METTDRQGRSVRLPYGFGDIVYHRASSEKEAGIVSGFIVRERGLLICVVWGRDKSEGHHSFFELTSEFTASIE